MCVSQRLASYKISKTRRKIQKFVKSRIISLFKHFSLNVICRTGPKEFSFHEKSKCGKKDTIFNMEKILSSTWVTLKGNL